MAASRRTLIDTSDCLFHATFAASSPPIDAAARDVSPCPAASPRSRGLVTDGQDKPLKSATWDVPHGDCQRRWVNFPGDNAWYSRSERSGVVSLAHTQHARHVPRKLSGETDPVLVLVTTLESVLGCTGGACAVLICLSELPISPLLNELQRHGGNTARLARRSDETLGVRVSVVRIAPSLLDLGRAAPTNSQLCAPTHLREVPQEHSPLHPSRLVLLAVTAHEGWLTSQEYSGPRDHLPEHPPRSLDQPSPVTISPGRSTPIVTTPPAAYSARANSKEKVKAVHDKRRHVNARISPRLLTLDSSSGRGRETRAPGLVLTLAGCPDSLPGNPRVGIVQANARAPLRRVDPLTITKGRRYARAALVMLSAVSQNQTVRPRCCCRKTEDRMFAGRCMCCRAVLLYSAADRYQRFVDSRFTRERKHPSGGQERARNRPWSVSVTIVAFARIDQTIKAGNRTRKIGEPVSILGGVTPGFPHVGFVWGDAADRRVFSRISRFLGPCIPALFRTHLASSSSAHKTSISKSAARIANFSYTRPEQRCHWQAVRWEVVGQPNATNEGSSAARNSQSDTRLASRNPRDIPAYGYGIRKVFACKSAIGSEACRPCPINRDPNAKVTSLYMCLGHYLVPKLIPEIFLSLVIFLGVIDNQWLMSLLARFLRRTTGNATGGSWASSDERMANVLQANYQIRLRRGLRPGLRVQPLARAIQAQVAQHRSAAGYEKNFTSSGELQARLQIPQHELQLFVSSLLPRKVTCCTTEHFRPTSRVAVGWCATDLGCGRLWVRILGKAWVLI
ncbi:hypothetical protein PR048_023217 [Dryococelus australis]|uniref:Uncharacterized protein n=1 Tax=Dryococelus australis TaxID=614101 RepID=A0ABQ9GTH7_9NEOP|nr:hypothetical protein PR048_023217 [Dryococelus australis]